MYSDRDVREMNKANATDHGSPPRPPPTCTSARMQIGPPSVGKVWGVVVASSQLSERDFPPRGKR